MNPVDDYIRSVKKANPALFQGKPIIITPVALENIIRQSFLKGFRSQSHPLPNLSVFNELFGKP